MYWKNHIDRPDVDLTICRLLFVPLLSCFEYKFILWGPLGGNVLFLGIGSKIIDLIFVFKGGTQEEEESGPKEGAVDEREAQEKAEEDGEGSTWVHSNRGLYYSQQMFRWNQVRFIFI